MLSLFHWVGLDQTLCQGFLRCSYVRVEYYSRYLKGWGYAEFNFVFKVHYKTFFVYIDLVHYPGPPMLHSLAHWMCLKNWNSWPTTKLNLPLQSSTTQVVDQMKIAIFRPFPHQFLQNKKYTLVILYVRLTYQKKWWESTGKWLRYSMDKLEDPKPPVLLTWLKILHGQSSLIDCILVEFCA